MRKNHKGSCHCGSIVFEVTLDLEQETGRCNCSFCARTRAWEAMAAPQDFTLLNGEQDLAEYRFGDAYHHLFCRCCGTQLFSRGHVAELGGDIVAVRVAALDDLEDAERAALKVRYLNGRDDAWHEAPAETRHL